MMAFKVKFIRNSVILDATNSPSKMMNISPKDMLGILDLKSIGPYKIKHGVLQQYSVNILGLNQQMYCHCT